MVVVFSESSAKVTEKTVKMTNKYRIWRFMQNPFN